ncbi:hypothetical protein [Gordonia sp. 'Campus']|uniref:hypothetical protein n=1 Tax=Gordonia sp. 'Campus' TaxID=2915824 RepID=UPI001EE4A935|nr:hypothetical protein [Gordonia sp. 'Campus']
MTPVEPTTGRVTVDAGLTADLSARLDAAASRLQTLTTELAEVLADLDRAVGVGESAHAFRRGFGPAGVELLDALGALAARVTDRRRGVTAGADALADADATGAATIDRADG